MKKILMVLTSHDTLGGPGRPTGFWLEEFSTPYYVFKDAGAEITLASPLGGQPPLDPKSDDPGSQTASTRRFMADPVAQAELGTTRTLSELDPADYDTVFYPGGHGPLWDLAEDPHSMVSPTPKKKPLGSQMSFPFLWKTCSKAMGQASCGRRTGSPTF